VVALYAELYAVERDAKELTPEDRLRLRRERSVPAWTELAAEGARLEAFGEPKSPPRALRRSRIGARSG
jgi:hypothetical protein